MGYQLIKEAKALEDYRVAVVFENGERGVFDCKPYFDMGHYKPLLRGARSQKERKKCLVIKIILAIIA